MRAINLVAIVILSCIASPALGQGRARDGATVGGVAGAVIGGIIGHQNDETPEGALIGGAVGAIAGSLLGRQQDAEIQRQNYYRQQAYYQQQQQAYTQQQRVVSTGVSANDLVSMARSGVSESLIRSQLQTKGVQRHLEVNEIISLHQQGVGDTIIAAFQAAPLVTQVAAAARPATQRPTAYQQGYNPQPVVVHQPRVIVHEPVIYRHSPVIYDHHPHHRVYHHPRHHYSGASFHFDF